MVWPPRVQSVQGRTRAAACVSASCSAWACGALAAVPSWRAERAINRSSEAASAGAVRASSNCAASSSSCPSLKTPAEVDVRLATAASGPGTRASGASVSGL